MKKSINYNLNKPDYADQYDLKHWNQNTDSIDSLLKENSENINNEVRNRESAITAVDNKITNIVNGTTIVKKAYNDENNNNIPETYQTKANKVNSWQTEPSDIKYPSEKLVKSSIDGEANVRTIQDNALGARIEAEAKSRAEADNTKLEYVMINGTNVSNTNKKANLQVSFKITDGSNYGNVVDMSNGTVTINLPSKIYGAVFN